MPDGGGRRGGGDGGRDVRLETSRGRCAVRARAVAPARWTSAGRPCPARAGVVAGGGGRALPAPGAGAGQRAGGAVGRGSRAWRGWPTSWPRRPSCSRRRERLEAAAPPGPWAPAGGGDAPGGGAVRRACWRRPPGSRRWPTRCATTPTRLATTAARVPPAAGARGRPTLPLLAQWAQLEAETARVVGPGGAWGEALALDALALHLRAAARVYAEVEASVAAVMVGRRGRSRPRGARWVAHRRRPRCRPSACVEPTLVLDRDHGFRGAADLVAAGEGLDGGRVRVVEVARGDGGSAWVVVVPGTQEWSPRAGANPFDLTTDVRAVTGDATLAAAGVAAALEVARGRAGARSTPADPVVLVGHSQGGILAAALASDPGFTARHRVTHVVTSGSPVGLFPVPATTRVLSVERGDDPVPRLDLAPNPDRSSWVTVRTTGDGPPVDVRSHRLEGYVATLRVAEGAPRGTVAGPRRLAGLGRRGARAAGPLGVGAARREGVAESTLVTPSSALATVLVDELVTQRRPRGRAVPRLPVGAAGVCRARRRARPAGSASTCGSTSAAPGSSRSGWPAAPVTRSRWSRRRARRWPTCTPRCSRPTTPASRWSWSAPTGPTSCAARVRTRRPSSRACSGPRTRYAVDLPAPVVRPGLEPVLAQHRLPGASPPRRAPPVACPGPVHLNVCLREPLAPDDDRPPADGPTPSTGGDDGEPVGAPGRHRDRLHGARPAGRGRPDARRRRRHPRPRAR